MPNIRRGASRADIARLITGVGGGWGDPRKRPRDRVLADLEEGYISQKAARRVYGQDSPA